METQQKIIALGADHNGITLKSKLIRHLEKKGFRCIDIGPSNKKQPVDYSDFAKQVAHLVANKEAHFGILICGTGIGMSIAANKIRNARAALVHNVLSAKKSREHNNANILCLGSWINNDKVNLSLTNTWLNEPFGEGRHVRRVEKIEESMMLS